LLKIWRASEIFTRSSGQSSKEFSTIFPREYFSKYFVFFTTLSL